MSQCFSIKLQSAAREIPECCVKVGEDIRKRFTFQDKGLVCNNRGVMTRNADTCSIVNINLDKNNYLLHLAPEIKAHKSPNNVLKSLNKVMENFYENIKRPKEEPTAVITGGRWFGEKDPKSTESTDFMNLLAMFFEERGIPLSIIFGKKTPNTLDNAFVYNKGMTIWNEGLRGTKLEKNPTREQVEEALKNNYEWVEIAPEHKIDFVVG